MNIQVERQEDHTARVSVVLDTERFDAAKQKAARKLSNRVNVPGFRKGKAPYRIVVNFVGEPAVVEEAVDMLGEEIYKEVLPDSGIEPYGPGSLDDVKFDETGAGAPTFIYSIPMQPDVDLGDYRSVRADFIVPDVQDAAVERSMRLLQEQNAVIEDSTRPAALGNRVTLDVHSFFLEPHQEAEAPESDADDTDGDDEAHDHDHAHSDHGEHFIHENDFVTLLNADYEPIAGFNAALVGMNVGDHKDFELTFPDDADDDVRGKTVKFEVTVKKIEDFTPPPLNDDLAARITANEEKPLTLLELRMRMRETLGKTNADRYRSEYSTAALEKIVEGATLRYPEMVVSEEVERALQRFDQNLRQQSRLTLQDYQKITKMTDEQVYAQFRPQAVVTVERALVLRELMMREGVTVTPERLNEEVETIIESYDPERREAIRSLFNRGEMRESVLDDLLTEALMDRIASIAQGDAPELTRDRTPNATELPVLEASEPVEVVNESSVENEKGEQS